MPNLFSYDEYDLFPEDDDISVSFSVAKPALSIVSEVKVRGSVAGSMTNASKVYIDKEPSKVVFDISRISNVKLGKDIIKLFGFLKFPIEAKYEEVISLAQYKIPVSFNYLSVKDRGKGEASLQGLSLKSNFLRHFLPNAKGVVSPSDKNSIPYNKKTDNILYNVKECGKHEDFKIEVPAIGCAGWFCGEVDKLITLCKGKLNITPLIGSTQVDTEVTASTRVYNHSAEEVNVAVKLSDRYWTPYLSKKVTLAKDSNQKMSFYGTCSSKAGVYREDIKVFGTVDGQYTSSNAESILVCSKDDFRGDPHIVTADGLGYDYFASGDYVLSRIKGIDSYEVQARFLPGFDTSWPQAVALRVGNDIVEIQGIRTNVEGRNINYLKIWVNNEEVR